MTKSSTGKKVLIIDDEALLAASYELVLNKSGYKVTYTKRAVEALDIIEKNKPDVILLDLLMPEMNGIEFLKILKFKKKINQFKIIVFSNIDNPELISATSKLGVKNYLLKVEYTPRQLVEKLDQMFGNKD